MGVKNASSCMKMAASLIAITCVLLGITPANSQEKTYDYGMDPTIVKNPKGLFIKFLSSDPC